MKVVFLSFSILFFASTAAQSVPPISDEHIKVDQFGYRPADRKVAVISNPVTGYNSNSPFTPGAVYQVRRWADDAVVYTSGVTAWNSGVTHAQSGDKVWWFDFSPVTEPGEYYVTDVMLNVRSHVFTVSNSVYLDLMKQVSRVFYYQRCGSPKSTPFAQTGWSDSACHTHNLQDTDCRLYNNNNPSTSKNLSGGWHDAGDYNKYVNFTFSALIDMMLAYRENPNAWGDNFNIPESGNGIPDILDEIKYELDWILKMQNPNGSVNCIVGVQNYASASPPSLDYAQRFYGPATTSATFTASALFALGALQFNTAGQTNYATILRSASENAWTWGVANPSVTFYNSGIIGAGEQEVDSYERLSRKMTAACFLYALTGASAYKSFFEGNYTQIHLLQWSYAYPFETPQQDMLLYYASLPGATSSVANAIRNAYRNSLKTNNSDNLPAYLNNSDAYRAYLSNQNNTWGSNTTKGHQGYMFLSMITYGLDTLNNTNYRNAAKGFLDYFHGVNPTSFCYITNMAQFGAENSINEIYHAWFTDGSVLWDKVGVSTYGPAPGYVTGGPNPTYSLDGCCPSNCSPYNQLCNSALVTPPLSQPIQKSYRDWNTSWPQNSWTITEPGIYTQAAYLRLLSGFVNASKIRQITAAIEGLYNPATGKLSRKDTLIIYLRNISAPYAIVDSCKAILDSSSMKAEPEFINAATGTYYIAIKHRNSLETWSRFGGEAFSTTAQFHFSFTDDSSKAFGGNQKRIDNSPLLFGIFSGDVNNDGSVDASDILVIENDAAVYAAGYIISDLNGDNSTDATDLAIADNNAFIYAGIIRP